MDLKISARNVRAIAHADIDISGITVLSGINGCGKSTIARMTYDVLRTAVNFDSLVDFETEKSIAMLREDIRTALSCLSGVIAKPEYVKSAMDLRNESNGEAWIKSFISALAAIPKELTERQRALVSKMHTILQDAVGYGGKTLEPNRITDAIRSKLEKISGDGDKKKAARSVGTFQAYWKRRFGNGMGLSTDSFNIFEDFQPVLDAEHDSVSILNGVKEVFYIDTPMSLGELYSEKHTNWRSLNFALQKKATGAEFVYKGMRQDALLSGHSEWVEDGFQRNFEYERPDRQARYDLLECATGLKSFAIIQMLYKTGVMGKDTLMLLDEPEAHLHPQWIPEYARLVVFLNKMLGVKFLVASHSPDMIRAIKYISEYEFKAEAEHLVKFYLAEPKDAYSFEFVPQGLDISKIFQAFNVSLDRIDEYSEDADVSESGAENA